MSNPTPGIAFNLDAKNLVVSTVIITSTAVVTTGFIRIAGDLVNPSLRKLTRRLERKNEELKNANKN